MQNRNAEKTPLLNNNQDTDDSESLSRREVGLLCSSIIGGNSGGGTALVLSQCAPTMAPGAAVAISAATGFGVGLLGVGLTLFCCPKKENITEAKQPAERPSLLIMKK